MYNPYQPPLAATTPTARETSLRGRMLAIVALLLLAMPMLAMYLEHDDYSRFPVSPEFTDSFREAFYDKVRAAALALGLLGNLALWRALRAPYWATWVFVGALVLGGAYILGPEYRAIGVIALLTLAIMSNRKHWKA